MNVLLAIMLFAVVWWLRGALDRSKIRMLKAQIAANHERRKVADEKIKYIEIIIRPNENLKK